MARPRNTREQTFATIMRRVNRQPNGCWEWPGKITTSGYGGVQQAKQQHYVHRFVWEQTNGPIPAGIFVCHTCDNPICCNPAHLFLGTPADNLRDARQKGRTVNPPRWVGENHHAAKLTDADVLAIRRAYRDGESIISITRGSPVCRQSVANIVYERGWTHLQEAS